MTNFDDFLNEQLKDPKFRAEYEALEEEYASMCAVVEAQRKKRIQYGIPKIAVKPNRRLCYSLEVRENRPTRNELRRHSKEERHKLKLASDS